MRSESELRPYQNRIATALYEHDELLCVVRPGGGKTAAALTAFTELQRHDVVRHALVIAPKRVARTVWPDEIQLWAHTADINYAVLTGSPTQRRAILAASLTRDITIVGLDVVQWLLSELSERDPNDSIFDLLVIDEVSKLRNPKGVRSNIMARHASKWRMIWGLSGTLRPSGAADLFMPARVVTRAKLWGKSFYKWQKQHFYQTDFRGYEWKILPGHEDIINAEIAQITVTLREDELPQLPELSVILDRFDLPDDAREQYTEMHRQLMTEAGQTSVLAASAAVATGKLAQIANGFIYPHEGSPLWIHDEKRQWLSDIIDAAGGRPTLLVYEYREDLAMMRDLLGDDLPYLGEGVTDKRSDFYIASWNRRELPFMALHPASGGHGLNLQHGGSDMVWVSPTWSPELWEQTIARLHRSGQTQPVMVRVCVANRTVDEMKLARVYSKMSAQAAFEEYLRQVGLSPVYPRLVRPHSGDGVTNDTI